MSTSDEKKEAVDAVEERPTHHRVKSSLDELSMLALVHEARDVTLTELEVVEEKALPKSTMVILTDTENLEKDQKTGDEPHYMVASLSDIDFQFNKLKVKTWNGTKFYSDYIKEGLEYTGVKISDYTEVVMLYESPSSATDQSTFHNREKFRFHDWPPPKSTRSKSIIGPCKYSLMNGQSFPSFLRDGAPPPGLMEHWQEAIPGVPMPRFVSTVHESDLVNAYLPVEQIKNHVNDPDTHYHLAGKDAIHLMTQKTTKLLPDTRTVRPCVVKTTHSMGSKGIFIIRDDEDEKEFEKFLQESGNPTFVVVDFVDIHRNVACHFFMHPNGEDITWFGSNENLRLPDGRFSSDSYLIGKDQVSLKRMQLPFVEEVVQYCKSLGFWGFCGVDVLFDSFGIGYMVDINPRVTGSCPALMTLEIFRKKYGFELGLFRRSGDINYYGSNKQLIEEVTAYNKENEGKSRIVIHSMFERTPQHSRINIGVYGFDMDECKTVLNRFAKPSKLAEPE
jgi:ATP-grasp domain